VLCASDVPANQLHIAMHSVAYQQSVAHCYAFSDVPANQLHITMHSVTYQQISCKLLCIQWRTRKSIAHCHAFSDVPATQLHIAMHSVTYQQINCTFYAFGDVPANQLHIAMHSRCVALSVLYMNVCSSLSASMHSKVMCSTGNMQQKAQHYRDLLTMERSYSKLP